MFFYIFKGLLKALKYVVCGLIQKKVVDSGQEQLKEIF